MSKARADFNEKNYASVISVLDRLAYESVLDDEAHWLYGQSFEANGPARNIKAALGSYQNILRDFPESRYYGDAQSRVAYLNKFYFDIR
jgi:outer membrane protein assembly factor BamD (BamD/ComL family)